MDDALLVRHQYRYDPETGEFFWNNPPDKAARAKATPGSPAGTVDIRDGNLFLRLKKSAHPASRLAWLYVHGTWPPSQLRYADPGLPLPERNRFENIGLAADKAEITPEALRRVVSYDLETGLFHWLVARKGVKRGAVAGAMRETREGKGYRYLRIDGMDYAAQRLAWLYVHGEWPKTRLSFRDGDSNNCRIHNLIEGGFAHNTRQDLPLTVEERKAREKARYRRSDLKRTFSLTESQYLAMHAAQVGLCAICHSPETETRGEKVKWLAVDHDHQTGAIRELLCSACNKLMGHFNDSIPVLMGFVAYLAKHGNPEAALILRQIELGRQAAGDGGAAWMLAGLLSEAA